MKVGVCGSRSINKINFEQVLPSQTAVIVTGGARGVDSLAAAYARANGLKTIIHLPDYKRHGRGAPLRRNDLIVRDSDILLAFWDGKSRGTKNTIDKAKKAGIPVFVITEGF